MKAPTMNAPTVNDAQIRTAAMQLAAGKAAELTPMDTIINDAKKIEMFIKFGVLPNTVKPAKSPTDATQ